MNLGQMMVGGERSRIGSEEIARLKENVDLAALIGGAVPLKRQGNEFVGCCPFHSEKTPSFSVVPKKQMYFCFGCGAKGDVISWFMQFEKLSFNEAVAKLRGADIAARDAPVKTQSAAPSIDDEAERKRKIEKARKIWNEAVPANGTLVEKYLASRGLAGVSLPPTIRFHARLWNAEKKAELPAMVGCVMAKNQIVGIHRTFLRSDGSGKADVEKAKLMLGSCRGGHVWIVLEARGKLAVAEGIETALTVAKACPNLPVWAALSLSNMSAAIPKSVTELILCADADNKDQRMADRVLENAARVHAMPNRIIRIARPEHGKDFNDMVRT